MPAPDVALVSLYPVPTRADSGSSGVATYTADLARALAAAGAAVTVIAQAEPGVPAVTVAEGVVIRRSFHRGGRALPAAGRAALATGAPVVHLQHEVFLYGGLSSLAGLPPTLQAWRTRDVGPVVTMHQVVDPRSVDRAFTNLHGVAAPPRLARAGIGGLQKAIGRLAVRTIVHEELFAANVPGAVVLPHGVGSPARPPSPTEKAQRRRAARRHLNVEPGRFVTLCFGFVAPYKGLEVVLGASELVPHPIEVVVAGGEHPRMVGDGYLDGLRARWGGRARFTGYVPEPDVARWFAAADVVVLAYPQPFSSSGVLALAVQHATPVVLSSQLARCIGAPDELGVHADPRSIATRLEHLAASPAALEQARDLTQRLGHDRSWPFVARRHLDLYREVGHGERASAG